LISAASSAARHDQTDRVFHWPPHLSPLSEHADLWSQPPMHPHSLTGISLSGLEERISTHKMLWLRLPSLMPGRVGAKLLDPAVVKVPVCLYVVGAGTGHCVVDEQNDDRADYGNQDAVKIHASHAHVAKGIEEPSTHNSPDDS